MYERSEMKQYRLHTVNQKQKGGKSNRKIGVTGHTIRTLRLLHSQSLIYQHFQKLLFPLLKRLINTIETQNREYKSNYTYL